MLSTIHVEPCDGRRLTIAYDPKERGKEEAPEQRSASEHDPSCSCKDNQPGTNYYVSVVDGPKFGLLAGPFSTHFEACEWVDRAREEAYRVDPKSWFYAFGTVAMKAGYRKPGKLNDLLGLEVGWSGT